MGTNWDHFFEHHELSDQPVSRWLRLSTIRLATLFNVNTYDDVSVIIRLIRAITEFRAMMFRKVHQHPDRLDALMTIDQSLQPMWSEIAKTRLDDAGVLH